MNQLAKTPFTLPRYNVFCGGLLLALGLGACFHQPPLKPEKEHLPMSSLRASRQLLVAFSELPSFEDRLKLWSKFNVLELEQVGKNALILVEAPEGTDALKLEEIKKSIAAEKGVRYAEPNVQMRIFK